jgi:drug/metabolite transporter (DMT)-like permease
LSPSITAALFAMILIGTADVINKRARQAGIPIGSYLIVQSVFFTLTIFILAAFSTGIRLQDTDLYYGLLAAVFGFTGFTLMLHSLSHGHASINYAIFRSSFVFSSAAAIVFLSEALSFSKITAVIVACTAICLFFLESKERVTANKSIVMALVAMLIAAGFQFIVKISTFVYSSPLSFILLMNLFFVSFVILYNIVLRNWRFPRQTFIWAPINGILMASATFFYVTALHKGELSTAIPIIQLSFIITAALSFFTLKERIGSLKIAGIILAALAIVILGTL